MKAKTIWSAALLVTMMTFVASAATIGVQAGQQEPGPWVHLAVTGDNDANININLPLAAIQGLIALAPETIVDDGQLQLGVEHEVPVAAIRGMWQELRDVGDAEFVTMQSEGRDLRIAREGDTILVNINEVDGNADDEVRVEIPVPVVNALLSGDGDTLNVRAALQELSTLRGELVRVIESDNDIRIWIDESPTP